MTLVTRDNQTVMLISNSEVQAFKRCRRKWMLEWDRGLTPIRSEMTGARPTGNRVHEALAAHYAPGSKIGLSEQLATSQVRDWDKITAQYGGPELVPDFVAADWKKSIDLEQAMIGGYEQWLAETGADAGLEVISVETPLEVTFEVPGVPVPVFLIGKLDMRAQLTDEYSTRRVFLDHKTAADFNRKINTLQQDEQVLHYQVLEKHADPDQPRTVGALYNLLRKVKRSGTAKPPFYQRELIEHSVLEVTNYERKLRAVARDLWHVSSHLANGTNHLDLVYPKPGDSCSWECDFKQVCSLFDDGSRVDDMLAEIYKTRDPLDRYKDEDRGSE